MSYAKDPELCAKYCPGGRGAWLDVALDVMAIRAGSVSPEETEARLSFFDKYEFSGKLKIFSEVVLEALIRFYDSPELEGALSRDDQDRLELRALWDCALAEAEELGAMAISDDKVLTLLC